MPMWLLWLMPLPVATVGAIGWTSWTQRDRGPAEALESVRRFEKFCSALTTERPVRAQGRGPRPARRRG